MKDKVVELGVGEATVESVIARLERYKDKIKGITVVVTWDDGFGEVFYNHKLSSELAFDALLIQQQCLHNTMEREDD